MKIKEAILNKPIIEETDRSKLPETVLSRVTYNICNIGERNANGRIYEKEVFDNVLNNETLQEMIENRRLFGQAEHPTETQSDLQLTSHVVHKMWIDENTNNVYQTLDVLDTPMGRIVDCLLRANCGVGVSTRAEGDLEESEDDKGKFSRVIPESYRYITTDFTADPSTFNVLPIDIKRNVASRVQAEMENKNATASERKFATQLYESLKVEKKDIKEKKYIKEGTWSAPYSSKKAEAIVDLLKQDELGPEEAKDILYDLYGNDSLFDELGSLSDKTTLQVKKVIKKYIRLLIKEIVENPDGWSGTFDSNVVDILTRAVSENRTLKQSLDKKLITIETKVKYEGKDYTVHSVDEAVGAITLRPDIQGRSVHVDQGLVTVDGRPRIEVLEDGTVVITPEEPSMEPEIPSEEDLSVQVEAEPLSDELEPEMEEKCSKRHSKKKMKEGMDQLVARKEELLAKKEAGKCTTEEQEELDEIEKKLSDMDVDIEEKLSKGKMKTYWKDWIDASDDSQIKDFYKTIFKKKLPKDKEGDVDINVVVRELKKKISMSTEQELKDFYPGDEEDFEEELKERHLPTEGEVSSKVMSGNVLKRNNETWIVKGINEIGMTITSPGSPGSEQEIPWEGLGNAGFVKIGEKVEGSKLTEDEWLKLDNSKLFEISINDDAAFKSCVDKGGRVRTVSGEKGHGLEPNEYVKYCFGNGKSYRGEVHKKENESKIQEGLEQLVSIENVENYKKAVVALVQQILSEDNSVSYDAYMDYLEDVAQNALSEVHLLESKNESKVNEQDEDVPESIRKQLQRTAYIISKLPDARSLGVGDTAVDEEIATDFGRLLREEPMLGNYYLSDEEDTPSRRQRAEKLTSLIQKELQMLDARLEKWILTPASDKFPDLKNKDIETMFYEILHFGKLGPVESTDLRIKEAITRAEKEKALETIEELSTQIGSLKNEISETKMKMNMLMKKVKEATSVYDEVNALRSKLEEKAKELSVTKEALKESKTKLEESNTKIKEANSNVKTLTESNQNRLNTVKEEYQEQLVVTKQEGIKEGMSLILSDYIDRRLAELELSIGENTRALLEECELISDVEDILEKTKGILRRDALHSDHLKEVRIRNQHPDPEQAKVDREVGNAFSGM